MSFNQNWSEDEQNYYRITQFNPRSATKLGGISIPYADITNLDIGRNRNLGGLDLDGCKFTSLDLSSNPKLRILYCSKNQLTNLNVSNNTALEYLHCTSNHITVLDVSKHTKLISLYCNYNQIKNLDTSNSPALEILSCGGNQLTHLGVSNNTKLTYLNCDGNQITDLDVRNNVALTGLSCQSNQLSNLDVSNNLALTFLSCNNNQLNNLNVNNNTNLERLECAGNQLTNLDVSNNTKLTYLYCIVNNIPLANLYDLAKQTANIETKYLGQQNLSDSTVLLHTPIAIDTVFYGVNTDVSCLGGRTDFTFVNGEITFLSTGSYIVQISNPAIANSDGSLAHVQQIFNVIDGTGIHVIPQAKTMEIWIQNDHLYVDSPVDETIQVYSVHGVLLYRFEKPAGKASYLITQSKGVVLIVKGSSGWVKKVIKN